MTPRAATGMVLLGFALLLVGVAYMYWPAAFVVAGLALAGFGLLVQLRGEP